MDTPLTQLSNKDQSVIAIMYLDYLTQGHICYGYQVQYSTLKGYMDSMATWVQTHTGCDIFFEALGTVPQYL